MRSEEGALELANSNGSKTSERNFYRGVVEIQAIQEMRGNSPETA